MTTPKFDSTINLGSVLTLATLLFGTGIFYARHEAALVDHDKRLVWLEAERMRDIRETADLRERLAGRLTSIEITQATLIDLLRSQRHATHPASQP
jgi:hypothetical protein